MGCALFDRAPWNLNIVALIQSVGYFELPNTSLDTILILCETTNIAFSMLYSTSMVLVVASPHTTSSLTSVCESSRTLR